MFCKKYNKLVRARDSADFNERSDNSAEAEPQTTKGLSRTMIGAIPKAAMALFKRQTLYI
jgi:hypothetical protein